MVEKKTPLFVILDIRDYDNGGEEILKFLKRGMDIRFMVIFKICSSDHQRNEFSIEYFFLCSWNQN
jgi:hypothetical protein